MNQLSEYVERAKDSLYFSGAHIAEHLDAFFADQADAAERLGRAERLRDPYHLFLVGSGGSLATMQTAKYALDSLIEVPVDAVASYELVWRRPTRLNERALVFVSSYSGETEDTVAALRYANERGARTVAIVGRPESTMGREADTVVPYASGAIYEVPIATMVLFAAGYLEGGPRAHDVAALRRSLLGLPAICERTLAVEEDLAEERARRFLHSNHLYVLGGGPLAPLAYKVAMSVVMENLRINATFSEAAEWRHGPVEALERLQPDVMVLLGTDESRELTERGIEFCRDHGAQVLVYDAADFGDEIHPLLTPMVMNSHTQWFIVYSAILRGITDLDQRVFMGHNLLATGGAGWP
jgi:fructoselysine-6-P-deglycase FrlB-like protein